MAELSAPTASTAGTPPAAPAAPEATPARDAAPAAQADAPRSPAAVARAALAEHAAKPAATPESKPTDAPPADPHAELLARLGELDDDALGKVLSHERLQKRLEDEANARASKQIDRKQKELQASQHREQANADAVKAAREWEETVYQARDDNPDYEQKSAALARMQQTQWAQLIEQKAANKPEVLQRSAAIVIAGLMSQLFQHPELKDALTPEVQQRVIQAANQSPAAGAEALWQLAKTKFSGHVPEAEVKQREAAAAASARDEMRKTLGVSPDTKRSDAALANGAPRRTQDVMSMPNDEFTKALRDGSLFRELASERVAPS